MPCESGRNYNYVYKTPEFTVEQIFLQHSNSMRLQSFRRYPQFEGNIMQSDTIPSMPSLTEDAASPPKFPSAPTKLLNVGKIMVVDDEKFNCDIIDGFLMILGFTQRSSMVEFAHNGEQAVKLIKNAIDDQDPYRFSLILMDCNMPFLDGYEATKRIRKLFLSMDIPRS